MPLFQGFTGYNAPTSAMPGARATSATASSPAPSAQTRAGASFAKAAEDVVLGGLILVLIAPLMALIAVAIKLTSRGPVLFSQERHGLDGVPIRVLKFRTMRLPTVAEGFTQAHPGDARITPLGRLLRNTSLDELPQFINVLRGDMSIVGPRPHPIALNDQYAAEIPELMDRHAVKPGITGLAQIGGARGQTIDADAMRRRVKLDLEYVRRTSVWLDLRIIAMTVVMGFFNRQP